MTPPHPLVGGLPSASPGPPCSLYLLLQHVLALLPHALHQLAQVRDAVARLHLLHGRVEQAESTGTAHAGAAERPPPRCESPQEGTHTPPKPPFPSPPHLQCTTMGVWSGRWCR